MNQSGMIAWFARNHVAANILMIVILAAGALSLTSVKREVFPADDSYRITVTVAYPGAAPEEVEEGICKRIENEVFGLEGVKKITSKATEGAGVVTVQVMRDFVVEVQEELGGVQILVNNAGIGRDGVLWRMEDHEWEAVLRTNLDGAFFFTREVAPLMRAQEHGKIVNLTSVHGVRSEFGIANYAASKAGLIGLTRSAAVELGPRKPELTSSPSGRSRAETNARRVPSGDQRGCASSAG